MRDILPGASTEVGFKTVMRIFLGKYGQESNFNVNAVSPGGDWGIAQMNQAGAVKTLNGGEMALVRESLGEHADAKCRQLAEKYLKKPMKDAAGCDAISIASGNPMKNIIYGMANYSYSRKSLEKNVFKDSNYTKKWNGMSPAEIERVKVSTAVLAHNTGAGGAAAALKDALKGLASGKIPTYDKLRNGMEAFYRRSTAGGYLDRIDKGLADIEKKVGGSCIL
jgi:hypothetical protein